EFDVEYPDRDLNRLTTAFRIFTVIPIAIVLASIGGSTTGTTGAPTRTSPARGAAPLVLPPRLVMLFPQKDTRRWGAFDPELLRFENRVGVYFALMTDRYPSTDEQQSVLLDVPYPDATRLNRWLPLVKWLLAIPHYVVLFFLYIGAFFAVIGAWFAILFTGRYPRGIFEYVEGVHRWGARVTGYAFTIVTDRYPPFTLKPCALRRR